jgi:hypothetical protein
MKTFREMFYPVPSAFCRSPWQNRQVCNTVP